MYPFVLHFLSWYFFFDSILDGLIQKEFLIHFPSPRGKDQLYLLKRTKPENVEISQRQDQFIKQIKKLSTFCCRGTLIKKGFTSTLPHVDESRIISVPNNHSLWWISWISFYSLSTHMQELLSVLISLAGKAGEKPMRKLERTGTMPLLEAVWYVIAEFIAYVFSLFHIRSRTPKLFN